MESVVVYKSWCVQFPEESKGPQKGEYMLSIVGIEKMAWGYILHVWVLGPLGFRQPPCIDSRPVPIRRQKHTH